MEESVMFKISRSTSSWLAFVAVVVMVTISSVLSGCNGKDLKIIDHVSFKPSDNLETVRVSLVFQNNIQAELSGGLYIKDYGMVFVNPYTSAEPFEVGFSLNTKVFNDQDYVKLTPTDVLPNGLPMGLGYPVAEIKGAKPISSQFDLYGYVDVLHTSWLGAAAIFGFINNQYFPDGLSISQVFLRDASGNPGVIASVFGPTLKPDGSMARAGGIALFANVRQLIAHHAIGENAQELTLRPELLPVISGPRAPEYEGNYKKLRGLEGSLVKAFNSR
jgi:hypothetical protein